MSEWWTYSLSDFLLFSPRTYYRLFELYNAAIWPLQIPALALGAAIFGLLLSGGVWRGRAIAAILAACWLWVAWAYLLQRYDTINWAARYFAAGFAAQAMLMSWTGIIRDRLGFRSGADAAATAGRCIFLFALVVFPLIGALAGRPWTQVEIFGVAPDPTAIATLGVLAAAHRAHWPLLVIPLIWCAISGATLWTMQSPDAVVVPMAAALALAVAGWKSLARGRQASPDQHKHGHETLNRRVMIVLIGLALYAAAGIAVAAAFVAFGVTRVLPEVVTVSAGARLLIFPGAAALWPYVLVRWLKSSR